VDWDSVWEQEKLEARKMLAAGAAESPASSAPMKMGDIILYERTLF
jgi:hypothetical protein